MSQNAPLTQMPGHLIRRLNQQSTAVFQGQLKAAGFQITSVQYSALETLEHHPGIDQATLAASIAYDPATIGGVVKRLIEKKLIDRSPSKEDRRAFRLHLSPDGQALLKHIRPIVTGLQDQILPNLTEAEKQTLVNLMQKSLQLPLAEIC